MRKTNKKGFTLVELLLVIAIIGILAAVLFVSLGKQRERARLTTFKENMRGLVTTYTACTDGGNYAQGTMGSAACTSDSDGNTSVAGFGVVPQIDDCDGEDSTNQAAIAVNVATGDAWNFTGSCNLSADDATCYAYCTADGCIFCNDDDLTYDNGSWGTCTADSNCN